jgi:metallo-beta-lactamase class B
MLHRILIAAIAAALGVSAQDASWTEPFPPHRVVGNVWYVGSRGLAAYLVTTPEGHILINSNLDSSVPSIRAAVEKLGFRFADIKILLVNQAHWDHCAGSFRIKELTAAKYMVMGPDAPEIEAGGANNFHYGQDRSTHFKPVKVDRVLRDGDEVKLGDAVLKAHLTPGHTKGCTTWTMKAADGGKTYDVVIVGGTGVNSGYKLVDNRAYPQIAEDYERTFRVLRALACDVFLGAHGAYYGMEQKYPRLQDGKPNPFIDPAGYKAYVDAAEAAFRAELKRQAAQ